MPSEGTATSDTGRSSPDAAQAPEHLKHVHGTSDGVLIRPIDPLVASSDMASVLENVTADFQGRVQKVSDSRGIVGVKDNAVSAGVIAKEQKNVGIPNTLPEQFANILPGNSDIGTETAEKTLSKKNLHELLVVGMFALNLRFGALNKNSDLHPLFTKVDTAIEEEIDRLMAVLPDSISSHQQIAHVMPALLQITAESIFKYIYRGQEKFSLEQSRLDVVGNYRVAFEAMNKEIQLCFPVPIASLEQIGREAQPKIQMLSQHEKDGMETYIKQHSAYKKEHEQVYKRYHAFQQLAQHLLPDDMTPEMFDWFLRGVDEGRNAILVHCEKRKIPQYEAICVTMKNNAKTLRDTAAAFFPGNPLFADASRIIAADPALSSEPVVSNGYDQLPDVSIWSADTTFASTLPENFEEGMYHIDDLNPRTLEAKIQAIFKTVKEDKTIGETLGIETKALAIVIPLLSRFRRIAKTVVTDFDGPISTLHQYQKIKAGFGFALQSLTGPHADSLKEYISQHFLRPWFADIETRVSAAVPAHEDASEAQAHEDALRSLVAPDASGSVDHSLMSSIEVQSTDYVTKNPPSDVVEQGGEKGVVSSMRRNTTALLSDFEDFSMITKEAFGLALRYAFERVVLKTDDIDALESLFVSAEGEQCFATYEDFNDRRTELISELRSMITSEDGVRFSQALRAAFAVFQSTLTAADGPLGTRISISYEKAFSYLESSLNVYFSPSA